MSKHQNEPHLLYNVNQYCFTEKKAMVLTLHCNLQFSLSTCSYRIIWLTGVHGILFLELYVTYYKSPSCTVNGFISSFNGERWRRVTICAARDLYCCSLNYSVFMSSGSKCLNGRCIWLTKLKRIIRSTHISCELKCHLVKGEGLYKAVISMKKKWPSEVFLELHHKIDFKD